MLILSLEFFIFFSIINNLNSMDIGAVAMAGDRMSEATGTHMNNLSIGPQTNK